MPAWRRWSVTISELARMAFCRTLLRVTILGGILLITPELVTAAARTRAAHPAPSATPTHPALSVFQQEQAMTPAQRIKRWLPLVSTASRRAGVPVAWINAVMRVESGGRTMLTEKQPMVSSK